MHSLLKRQLKRHLGDGAAVPAEWQKFVDAVDGAYRSSDEEHAMLARSLDLSSRELFEANSELRGLFQAIPDLLFRIDHTGVILAFKAGTGDELALDSRGMLGQRIQEIAPFKDLAPLLDEPIRTALDLRQVTSTEYAVNHLGEELFYEARVAPLPQDQQLVVIIRNITARRRAEVMRVGQNRILEMVAAGAPLKDLLAQLALLIESQAEGMLCSILLMDADGRHLRHGATPNLPAPFVNSIGALPVAEGVGSCGTAAFRRTPVIVTDIAEDPKWAEPRQLALSNGLRACWSTPILTHNGDVLGTFAMYYREPRPPTENERRLTEIGTQLARLAIERTRAAEELQRTVSLVRSTLESTTDGILVVDLEGRIVSFNQRFVSLWQIPPEVVAQRNDEAALAHVVNQLKEPDAFMRRVLELYAKPDEESFDVIEFKDGRVFERHSSPQRLNDMPIGRVWSFRDITERKRLQEQFLQAQKMEAFGQLAGGVAHDFNNMLTVVLSGLSLLRDDEIGAAQRGAMIEDCIRAAQRAANLTGQLLTFSRRHRIEPRNLDLNEAVTNMTKMFQRLIGEHILLETRHVPGKVGIHADPGMIEQVLMNLVVNARDAMPRGGRLTLETAPVEFAPAVLAGHPKARPGSFVRLTVGDTGTGIAPGDLEHIFEPFFTTKDVGKGTGLGLATVFGIVEQHNGWIEVESAVGVGTSMRVFLPCSDRAEEPGRLAKAASSQLRGGSETILLAEDEYDVRSIMRQLLTRHGYRVHAAESAEAACKVWQEHHAEIQLLITDMVMPGGVGGLELAKRLQNEKPALRVMYCSGYNDEMIGPDSPLREQDNFLAKPFDMHVFLRKVRDCIDAPR